MGGALVAFLVHVAMLYLPWGQKLLDTAPVSPVGWGVLIVLALSILLVMELHKIYWHRFGSRRAVEPDPK
jgi:hypothetical protein